MINPPIVHYKPKHLQYYVNNIAPLKMIKIQREIKHVKN